MLLTIYKLKGVGLGIGSGGSGGVGNTDPDKGIVGGGVETEEGLGW